MSLTTEEFRSVYDTFFSTCTQSKSTKTKFLRSVQREFGYSDILELRRNLVVVLERNGAREMFAYAQSSDRFYPIAVPAA